MVGSELGLPKQTCGSWLMVAVPSWSGRNHRKDAELIEATLSRRPLMVGSERASPIPLCSNGRSRRPLMVGSERSFFSLSRSLSLCRRPLMVGSEPGRRPNRGKGSQSPSPHGRVGTGKFYIRFYFALSPSPHGRVGTVAGIDPCGELPCRRPLMVGSEP